jgi:thiosulfate/3-mercaptopyruvate sulfurtransferase
MRKLPCLLLLLALPVAALARDKLLVDADALAKRLGDAHTVVLQVGDPATYAAGHIPGARLIPQGGLARSRSSDPKALLLELPDPKALQAQLQQLGVGRESHVVVAFGKDEFAGATRVIYTLEAAGWGGRVMLLDGGVPEWQRRGHPVTTESAPVPRVELTPLKLHPRAVDLAFLQEHKPGRNFVLLDARAPAFYNGIERSTYPSGQAPAGHLPGAHNLPFSAVTSATLTLKSQDELRRLFKEAGVDAGDEVAVYCHIGQQASAVQFAARLVGIDAKVYDGSFQEWTNFNLPVETTAPP